MTVASSQVLYIFCCCCYFLFIYYYCCYYQVFSNDWKTQLEKDFSENNNNNNEFRKNVPIINKSILDILNNHNSN